ncbi:MotA/TolQ/ExbB proton channel family protein [Candidatus Babeliales bacterium]|nr:MotA/TolQ/ExbB proton channel family protein [Candidatus Babeliales bacterium]MCF7899436.1 MotA/TolQ/ExbB proton channel family protein [Candidatus Babeliales bacterium]
MFGLFFNSPAGQLITQSDFMTKFILLGLFILSIICCAIIAFKIITLRFQKNQLSKMYNQIKRTHDFNELINIGKEYKDSLGGKFLVQNLTELKNILENKQQLSLQDFEYLDLLAAQSIDQLIKEGETYLPILGTSASVSPLIGLFGTIWGLIHSFVNISQEKSADIAIVAPGIAEALLTTLAGLIVAIPAVIAFQYFSNQLSRIDLQLNHVSDKFLNIIKQKFVK